MCDRQIHDHEGPPQTVEDHQAVIASLLGRIKQLKRERDDWRERYEARTFQLDIQHMRQGKP